MHLVRLTRVISSFQILDRFAVEPIPTPFNYGNSGLAGYGWKGPRGRNGLRLLCVGLICIFGLLAFSVEVACAWQGSLQVTDEDGDVRILYFGWEQAASDGLDTNLGEIEQPPFPPRSVTHAVWMGLGLGNGILRDIRAVPSTADTVRYFLQLQSVGSVSLGWDYEELGRMVRYARLADAHGGHSFSVDMLVGGSARVDKGWLNSFVLELVPREDLATLVPTLLSLADSYSLGAGPAYPNPCNASVSVVLQLETRRRVELTVLNSAGQKVHQGKPFFGRRGKNVVVWDGRAAGGKEAGSGCYWLIFTDGHRYLTRQVTLLR